MNILVQKWVELILEKYISPSHAAKASDFKMSLLKLNWRKAAKFSIQRYFQLIPSSISTWTIQLLESLHLDHLFTDHLFYLSISFFPSLAYAATPESPPYIFPHLCSSPLPIIQLAKLLSQSNLILLRLPPHPAERKNKQQHWRVLFQRYNTNLKGLSAPLSNLTTLSWPAFATAGQVCHASTPPLDAADDVDFHFLQTQKQTGDNLSISPQTSDAHRCVLHKSRTCHAWAPAWMAKSSLDDLDHIFPMALRRSLINSFIFVKNVAHRFSTTLE